MEKQEKETKYYALKAEFLNFEQETVVIEVPFRQPTMPELERTMKDLAKNANRGFRNLCLAAVKPEAKEELRAAINEYPGVASTFANEILERSGFGSLGN